MPTYRIRKYYSYYYEYLVDAPGEMEAKELVETYTAGIYPTTHVEQTEESTCDDYQDTTVEIEDKLCEAF